LRERGVVLDPPEKGAGGQFLDLLLRQRLDDQGLLGQSGRGERKGGSGDDPGKHFFHWHLRK
jgi:hypothetical protein